MTVLRFLFTFSSPLFRMPMGFEPASSLAWGRPGTGKGLNYLYYLSVTTHRREEPFISAGVVDVVLDEFRGTAEEQGLLIKAWCFLPGRLDLLVQTSGAEGCLRQFVRLAKARSARRFAREFGRPLWLMPKMDRIERRGDETKLAEQVEDLLQKAVDLDLVEDFADYPFLGKDLTEGSNVWGSRWGSKEQTGDNDENRQNCAECGPNKLDNAGERKSRNRPLDGDVPVA
ncbi:MAG: hypothetical protein JW937_08835 [Candidatus Omnitrophica bacterium]|nr:hypothetical protein [Candidatus Omnitrophota bacterium]